MVESAIAERLTADMKSAMKAKDKQRLGTIRLALSEIKQRKVDTREEVDDTAVLAILDKMVKQRRDSLSQYNDAGRDDLAAVEQAEIDVLVDYLPEALSDQEISTLIDDAIAETGASGMADMGTVMAAIKPKAQGRADMKVISGQVRAKLG